MKPPTNLPIPNPLLPLIPKTTPKIFHNPPFRPINASQPLLSLSTPSYPSQVTPTYTPSFSDRSTNNSPDIPQISSELENYITLQQQIIHPNTLTIHHLSSMTTNSGPSTPTPLSDYTQSSASTEKSTSTNRAYRTFKRKFQNHPFTTKPGTAKEYIDHPKHKNTKQFLQTNLPSFPQYTLNTSTTNNDTTNYVDEYVLIPTLHWTS